jgi:hypothetical protein
LSNFFWLFITAKNFRDLVAEWSKKKTIEVVARAPQAAVGVRRACPKLIFCEPCGDKRRADWLDGSQQ